MTNEQIKDIKTVLVNCADTYRDCLKCLYSRKNTADGISHCKDLYLDALALINEYEQRIVQLEKEKEQIRKGTAKDILQPLYNLCKVRKEIQWDDIWFLVKRYGVEVDDE